MDYIYDPKALYHYGVPGMKWGQHSAKKAYSSGNVARGNAIADKHIAKATKKVAKLDKQYAKLSKTRDKQIRNANTKAAKYQQKAADASRKLSKQTAFTEIGVAKREKLMKKQMVYQAKADNLKSKSEATKAKMAKNRQIADTLTRGASELNTMKVNKGKNFVKG